MWRLLWFNNFAINVKGRILVPLRAIFEQFHATVTWDQETQSIMATRLTSEILLKIGSTSAKIKITAW